MKRIRNSALIIFEKNAVQGKVKTRLAATIGEERALQVYKQLVMHTHTQIQQLENVDRVIFFSDFIEKSPLQMFQPEFEEIQAGGDLGERMSNAFQSLFQRGYKKVIIIGTDCPEIKTAHIETAFRSLEKNEVCIGPALDGGYFLLGMRRFYESLFQNIPWSSSVVTAKTTEKLNLQNISFELLKTLRDLDTAEDLSADFLK